MAKRKFTPIPDLSEKYLIRFWSRVDKRGPDECWPWTAALSHGYGNMSLPVPGGKKEFGANRISLFLKTGNRLEFLQALHTCDNPPCCNPDHLYAGDERRNILDCIERNRYRGYFSQDPENSKGANNPNSKLTQDDILEIRKFKGQRMSAAGLAVVLKRFNICSSSFYYIRSETSWKSLKS